MIDIKTGTIFINNKLVISKGYLFDNFKECQYYNNNIENYYKQKNKADKLIVRNI